MKNNFFLKKGQTLMEAVVAIVILALVWIAAVNVIIVSKAAQYLRLLIMRLL